MCVKRRRRPRRSLVTSLSLWQAYINDHMHTSCYILQGIASLASHSNYFNGSESQRAFEVEKKLIILHWRWSTDTFSVTHIQKVGCQKFKEVKSQITKVSLITLITNISSQIPHTIYRQGRNRFHQGWHAGSSKEKGRSCRQYISKCLFLFLMYKMTDV